MAAVLQLRRGIAALATSNNVTLSEGELGLETDTGRIKIGDGLTAWNSLPYVTGVVATSATSFPASPAFADECYRTDLDEWYKYNGTVWTQL